MSSKGIKDLFKEADDSLVQNRRGAAIRILRRISELLGKGEILSELNRLQTTYDSLCHYFIEGSPDESRHRMLGEITSTLYTLRDSLARDISVDKPGAYYSSLRLASLRRYNLNSLISRYNNVSSQLILAASVGDLPNELNIEKYELLDSIFTAALVSFINREDLEIVSQVLKSPDADEMLQVQLVSAMTLSLCAWFDPGKLDLILEMASHTDISVKVRCRLFIAIIFSLRIYPNRVQTNTKLMGLLQCISDDADNKKYLMSALKAIVGTCETERVARKVKDEVIPEIMKLRPDMMARLKDVTSEMDPESLENNPEWQEMLDKSGISEKLQELSEMQNDGADLMMVTFAQLKKFPFFNKIGNWFIPYDSKNPQLPLGDTERSALEQMSLVAPMVCDSDKYSLALALGQTPEAHRKMMLGQFEAQFQQLSDEIKERIPEYNADFNQEVIKAVRDLYRYFNLGRNTEDFYNPMDKPFDFTKLPVIGNLFSDPDFLEVMAEFYLKGGFYREALSLFKKLTEISPNDYSYWQKIGFCYQKRGSYSEALSAYMKSELLGGNNLWLTKKLAFVCRKEGKFAQALDYYEQALSKDPENIKLLVNAAHCALESNNVDIALRHYYHANYLRPDDIEINRWLAWAEFVKGNYAKSISIHDRHITDQTCVDLLNLGHNYLMSGNLKDAYNAYRSACKLNREEFEMAFLNDENMLRNRGIDSDSLNLLLDAALS